MKTQITKPALPLHARFFAALTMVALALLFPRLACAQIVLSNTNTYTENFNGMGTNTNLPTGWKMSGAGSGKTNTFWANATNLTSVNQVSSSGSPNTGGRYNWGFSNQTNNRAIGFMSSGSYAVPNSIMVAFTNATGLTITNLAVSYDLIRFRINSTAATNVFYISDSSTNWGTALATNSWNTNSSTYFFDSTVASTNKQSVSLTNAVNIADGGIFYMMWTFEASSGSNSQGIGLDNFQMNIFTAAASAGNFWVGNDTTLGGSGTWTATGGTSWRTTETDGTGGAFDATNVATFGGASAGTVTVSGTVSPQAGITFKTTGYVVEGDSINLAGATISSNTITTDTSVGATINSKLSGSNGLTKAGAGTLILGGANDYTGGTLVSAGRLIGDTTSLQGTITNNAAVTFSQTTNGTYSSVLSGSGSLVKDGSGSVTLSGANTYSGGTLVSAGRLIGDTRSLQGAITNNAAVTFSQTTNGTYSGAMSGSGSLVKDGSGDVTLSGANSYSGGTLVSGGTLIGDAHSLQGDITNNASVTFNQATNGTYAGVMSGSGIFEKTGAHELTLSGANSYSGGTVVTGGRLIGTTTSLQGDIDNNAEVVFHQATSGTYSGSMSGTGSLVKNDTGDVTLGGGNSYSGGTTVNKGGLIATTDTALGSGGVQINEGSTLAKSGVTLGNDFVIGSSGGGKGADVILQGWDLTGANSAATWGVTTLNTNLTSGSLNDLTRGAGADASAGTNSFRTTGFKNDGISLTNTDYFQWKVEASTGNKLYLSTLDADFNGTSSFAAAPGVNMQFAYSLNGTNFTLINSPVNVTGAPGSMSQIDLSGINDLQGLDAGATVTFRYYATGQTTTGGWGFYSSSSGVNGLEVGGYAGTGTPSGSGTIGIDEAGSATFTGGITVNNDATFTAAATNSTATFSGVISGSGAMSKSGAGTVTFSGSSANTQTGKVTISNGTLELAKTAGAAAIAGDLQVNSGAKLLLSASDQVVNTSKVTLSGGTITRGAGVSETFSDLDLTAASFIDFGTAHGPTDLGTLSFGTYTPSSLLTVNNFFEGNVLVFKSDLSSTIHGALFSFDNGFTSSWDGDSSTFTITAIPEPSAYLALAALIGLMLWPMRKAVRASGE